MIEEDADFQDDGEDNTIKLTDEFKKDLMEERCECCAMVDVLSFFKNDEKKGLKDFENDTVKQTKEYLNAFNRYGVNPSNASEIPFTLRKILDIKKGIFSQIELSLLLDLSPTTAEEAFNLIPSLKKKLKAEEMNEYLIKLDKKNKNVYN